MQIEVIRALPLKDSHMDEYTISIDVAIDFFKQDDNGRIRDSGIVCCEVSKCSEQGNQKDRKVKARNNVQILILYPSSLWK